MLTSENTVSFISLLSLKKASENKVVCRKHFNSPSPLLFRCSESSRQKLFWKVSVLNFFVEILERHQGRISFSYIVASWRVTFLLQRLLKSQVVTKGFNLIPSWQLCRVAISKKTHFFQYSISSCFYRLYCWLNNAALLWIQLFNSLFNSHLSLFSLLYYNWHANIGIIYSKEITTTANITTTTVTNTNYKVDVGR